MNKEDEAVNYFIPVYIGRYASEYSLTKFSDFSPTLYAPSIAPI